MEIFAGQWKDWVDAKQKQESGRNDSLLEKKVLIYENGQEAVRASEECLKRPGAAEATGCRPLLGFMKSHAFK